MRGSDSFAAFAEILALARSYDVDLVLLAGDLFHDNKPSRRALHRAMAMLRDACFFDRPSSLRYQSDPGLDLPANSAHCSMFIISFLLVNFVFSETLP